MTVISETNEREQRAEIGASYVRWGRKVCEGNATLVYKGDVCFFLYLTTAYLI